MIAALLTFLGCGAFFLGGALLWEKEPRDSWMPVVGGWAISLILFVGAHFSSNLW
jgi:hypothetical protein